MKSPKPTDQPTPTDGAPTALPAAMTGRASPAKAALGDKPVFAYIASLPEPQPLVLGKLAPAHLAVEQRKRRRPHGVRRDELVVGVEKQPRGSDLQQGFGIHDIARHARQHMARANEKRPAAVRDRPEFAPASCGSGGRMRRGPPLARQASAIRLRFGPNAGTDVPTSCRARAEPAPN